MPPSHQIAKIFLRFLYKSATKSHLINFFCCFWSTLSPPLLWLAGDMDLATEQNRKGKKCWLMLGKAHLRYGSILYLPPLSDTDRLPKGMGQQGSGPWATRSAGVYQLLLILASPSWHSHLLPLQVGELRRQLLIMGLEVKGDWNHCPRVKREL